MHLVEWVEARQAEEHLNDVEMSKKLGLSQPYWSRLQNDKRSGQSYLLVCGALRAYPERWAEIFAAVHNDCNTPKTPSQVA